MYGKILVAIDGSDTSNAALDEAIKLAKEQGAALRLLHVVDETPAYTLAEFPFPVSEYKRIMREAGERLIATVTARLGNTGVKFDAKLETIDSLSRRICDAIAEEAKTWPADLIVIGTHGYHGFDRMLLGSVAEGVIRTAATPVLIIHGKKNR